MALLKYNGKNVFGVCLKGGDIVRLLPGINEVDDNHFLEMKTHPLFIPRIHSGTVLILQETIDKEGKRTISEMLKIIPEMLDVKSLKKMIENDGREKVISAAKAQIEKIKNPSKAKGEENEHFG